MEDYRYMAKTAANLRRYFFNHHYTYRLHIEEDGSVPSYCRACDILMSLYSLLCGHIGGKQCKGNIKRDQQRVRNEATVSGSSSQNIHHWSGPNPEP